MFLPVCRASFSAASPHLPGSRPAGERQNQESPRFPLKGSLKEEIDVGLGVDDDMDQPPNHT